MPATTSAYRRIEAGAILTFNDGTTTWTFTSIEPGTLRWKPGFYEPLNFTERGVQQFPYEGDGQITEFELDVKYAGAQAANDVGLFLLARDTTTGLMKSWTIVLKNPSVKGGATGEQITFATCYLAEGPEFKAGTKFDMLSVKMKSIVAVPAVTTY